MLQVDIMAVKAYGLQLLQMMENAGRSLASAGRSIFLNGDAAQRKILVLAGKGGNGGGALAAARRLAIWGAQVTFVLSDVNDLSPAAAAQAAILRRMGLEQLSPHTVPFSGYELLIDGLIGYSLKGAPRGIVRDLISAINQSGIPVLSLDLPSGLDASTGEAIRPVVKANATLTLALPKKGLFCGDAEDHAGNRFLADIGIPFSVYEELGIKQVPRHLFSEGDIIHLSA